MTTDDRQQTTDIVVATCERLPLLRATVESIRNNTRTPYRLHVIDDGSVTGNQQYLRRLKSNGVVHGLILRSHRAGICANLRTLYDMTSTPLIIYCDDDQLCPKVEPDWLSRLLAEMEARPGLGLLSLNNPHGNVDGDKRHKLGTNGAVTFCERSGGSFMCIRRKLLPQIAPEDGKLSPVSAMCARARQLGWQNGYLTYTYCRHIGTHSVRNGWDLSAEIAKLAPLDPETHEPREEYRG